MPSGVKCEPDELARHGQADHIAALYAIEQECRGRSADERRAIRQERTRPLLDDLKIWLEARLAAVSKKSTLAEAIDYALVRLPGLTRFIDDGRIEIDSNVFERAIRPIALNRKNALFAGSDSCGEHWAILAALVETAKLNRIEPRAFLADILGRLVAGHPINGIDELLPWSWAAAQPIQRAA